jgi:cytochrome c oxidase subunit 2
MGNQLNMFPENASTVASQVDYVYLYLLLVCSVVALGVVVAIVYFAIKYRRNPTHVAIQQVEGNHMLEITWSVIPLILMLTMFGWGTWLYMRMQTPPKGALDFYVVGKQWMWKLQHPTGQREINELHVPVNQPVRLTLTSEDVIHAFFVPAFRIKRDVVPGRYTQTWFEATKIGTYHLFCAEYCGTKHSQMIGTVHVMSPSDYDKWLSGNLGAETAEEAGKKLFEGNRCDTCHKDAPDARGAPLWGVFGSKVSLRDGGSVLADDEYLRDSILHSTNKVVAGFEPIMPLYAGQLTEEQVLQLVAYIKTLKTKPKETQ